MNEYGVEIFDANANLVLGMQHFTIQEIFRVSIPKQGRGSIQTGWRSDYIEFAVPGYDPDKCYVVIKPAVYASYDQPGYDDGFGFTPTFRDIGPGKIGIVTYVNYREYRNDNWYQYHRVNTVACSIVVVKVL
ncbi:hypothetical protein N5J76_02880 [Pseudomonas sp. GD03855]|nr:hypothetical protein [Pseudomonas sp. GD03856]MDH2263863.1 hypothetical protein [Pseudomonas sp. GD03855]